MPKACSFAIGNSSIPSVNTWALLCAKHRARSCVHNARGGVGSRRERYTRCVLCFLPVYMSLSVHIHRYLRTCSFFLFLALMQLRWNCLLLSFSATNSPVQWCKLEVISSPPQTSCTLETAAFLNNVVDKINGPGSQFIDDEIELGD